MATELRAPDGGPTAAGVALVNRYLRLRPSEGPRRALERLPTGTLRALIETAEAEDRASSSDRRLGIPRHLWGI